MKFSVTEKIDVHCVFIINYPSSASAKDMQNNLDTYQYLIKLQKYSKITLHIINCEQPLKHGVGQARKIGMDYACQHILHSPEDYLISLDADTNLDPSFLFELNRLPTQQAWTCYFSHPTLKKQDQQDQSIFHYELYLRYLAQAMAFAKSAFSYIPMGSTFGVNKKTYEISGGMLEKDATEDFHFLNKLRKITPIVYLPQLKVYPAARKSKRVYLGTGFYLVQNEPKVWLPHLNDFKQLKLVIESIRNFWTNPDVIELQQLSNQQNHFLQKLNHTLIKQKNNSASQASFDKRALANFDALDQLRFLKLSQYSKALHLKNHLNQYACQLVNIEMKKMHNTLNYYRKLQY